MDEELSEIARVFKLKINVDGHSEGIENRILDLNKEKDLIDDSMHQYNITL